LVLLIAESVAVLEIVVAWVAAVVEDFVPAAAVPAVVVAAGEQFFEDIQLSELQLF
jgi:hypothetical protein